MVACEGKPDQLLSEHRACHQCGKSFSGAVSPTCPSTRGREAAEGDTLAGVIDSDYRGEVRVGLVNHGDEPFAIAAGDRVAQLLLQRVERARFVPVTSVENTNRGEGGFGSTGR